MTSPNQFESSDFDDFFGTGSLRWSDDFGNAGGGGGVLPNRLIPPPIYTTQPTQGAQVLAAIYTPTDAVVSLPASQATFQIPLAASSDEAYVATVQATPPSGHMTLMCLVILAILWWIFQR